MGRYLNSLRGLWEIGGSELVYLKIRDKLCHSQKGRDYMLEILKNTKMDNYPKLIKSIWKMRSNEPLDLDNPKSFNEKIQWMKINDTTSLKIQLTDKYLVRNWIEKKIGKGYLIPLLGVWDSFDEINFDELPNSFVLKCNHGSGMNIVVKDKNKLDYNAARAKMNEWINDDFAFLYGLEMQYKDISRKIIAEEYIEQIDNNLLDYKIHVFAGEPKLIQVIGDRNIVNHTGKEIFLDLNWKPNNLMYHTYDKYEKTPSKPDNLEEMLDISRVLGADFRYVRVDLYDVDGKIYFGEMTFTPASGYGKWDDEEANRIVGSWINID